MSVQHIQQKSAESLKEDVGTAVNNPLHSQDSHIAKAISVNDSKDQVVQRCSPVTLVPSDLISLLGFSSYEHTNPIT